MDGFSNKGANTGGGGGVIRDIRGTWVMGFTMKLDHATVEEVEAWRMLRGLRLAWEKGLKKVIVE